MAFDETRRDRGAPVEVLASGAHLRRREYDTYVDLAEAHGQAGMWMDVGCGTGELLACAAGRGFTPVGLEVTSERGNASLAAVPTARLYTVPLEELSLPPASFDVVSLINVFSHLPRPAQTFGAIHALLKARGVLILRTGEIHGANPLTRRAMVRTIGDENQWLGSGTLQRYADRIGFTVVERSYTPYLEWVFSAERLQMPSASPHVRIAKAVLRALPGRAAMVSALAPLSPMGSVLAVLRKA